MRGQKRCLAGGLSLLVLSLAPSLTREARAAENQYWDGGFGEKAERRSDVVLGASTGLVLGNALAYPNEVAKIDNPDFEVNTGFGVGAGYALWVGGALKDWFVFGIGGFGTNISGSDVATSSGGVFLHVEAYPLFYKGEKLRDLAFYADFGAGSLMLDNPDGEDGEGGFVSVVGFGSAYELWRVGHFAFGPNASYTFEWSQTGQAHFAQLGLRAVFYGGPG